MIDSLINYLLSLYVDLLLRYDSHNCCWSGGHRYRQRFNLNAIAVALLSV